MKTALSLVAVSTLLAASQIAGAEAEGIALAIVYDTSGSMRETVRDATGRFAPKYRIANRALSAIAAQINTFLTNASPPRQIHAGLFTFDGRGTRAAVEFGPFDPAPIQAWAKNFSRPGSGTPLGAALEKAADTVLSSPLPRKHVLILTDGINTVGRDPAAVLPGVLRRAQQQQAKLAVHFVAFDIDAKVFDPLKKLGATVVGASDEKQLNTQLDFILQRKILLEDEEPKKN